MTNMSRSFSKLNILSKTFFYFHQAICLLHVQSWVCPPRAKSSLPPTGLAGSPSSHVPVAYLATEGNLSAPGYFNMLLGFQAEFTLEKTCSKGQMHRPTEFPDSQEEHHHPHFTEGEQTPSRLKSGNSSAANRPGAQGPA